MPFISNCVGFVKFIDIIFTEVKYCCLGDDMQKNKGFTLIELMVTIAVLAIIAMMAAPSFTNMLNKRKLEGELKDLVQTLSLARSQATLLRTNTTVGLNSSLPSTPTNFFWTPETSDIVILNIPNGHNSPPNIVFNAQGMFIPRSFTKMKKVTNADGDEVWVADQIRIESGEMVNQLEHYPRTITLCSKKTKTSKTITYSVVGALESVTEGTCT